MNRNDWIVFAWVWMVGMTCLGVGLLAVPALLPQESGWVSKASGTALLLVAASVLFVVVFEALAKAGWDRPASVASGLTAVLGYAGTVKVLESENTLLLAVVIVATFYIGWMGVAFVMIARLGRMIFKGSP